MKDYILLLRANSEMPKEAFNDPKELELRSKWIANMHKLDIISNLGGTMPPTPTMASTIFNNSEIKQGPFMESLHFLTGFIIIKANDLKEAQLHAASNPIIKAGGSVEVREIILR